MPLAPTHLRDESGRAVFTRRPDLYAIRQDAGVPVRGDARALIPDEDGAVFVIYPDGDGAHALPGAGPVYEAGAGGPLAVPTGRVFVRLAEGHGVEEARTAFAGAGFRIERIVSHAPHAAWLRPDAGGAIAALPALDTLRQLPDVVHVEPQMLLERRAKHT